jgi:hypothetical protein
MLYKSPSLVKPINNLHYERIYITQSKTPADFQVYDKHDNLFSKILLNRIDYELLIHKTYSKIDYLRRHIDSDAVICDSYLNGLAIVAAIAHWNLQKSRISGLDIMTDLFTEYDINYNDKKLLTYFGVNKIHMINSV